MYLVACLGVSTRHLYMPETKTKLGRLRAARTRGDLAALLAIDLKHLTYLLYKLPQAEKYTSFHIKKKSGGNRRIQAPIDSLKSLQRKTADLLQDCIAEIEEQSGKSNSASHGFRRDKSVLTNASVHRNKRYVLNLDLKDFFPSITFPRVRGFLMKDQSLGLAEDIATTLAQIACAEDALPQGSPCSPVISNLIAGILDLHLSRLAKNYGCRYTRYADDITFSTNNRVFPSAIAFLDDAASHDWQLGRQILGLIKKSGFAVNEQKTRMQYENSRQQVTGIVVHA
ncbi:MAG: RNA-directed DNA polymerase, partial [Proteobacteria bacterium]